MQPAVLASEGEDRNIAWQDLDELVGVEGLKEGGGENERHACLRVFGVPVWVRRGEGADTLRTMEEVEGVVANFGDVGLREDDEVVRRAPSLDPLGTSRFLEFV